MSWSAKQYSKFETERNRPIHDLLARIPTIHVKTAVDIGCGPGNSTELLGNRFPDAVITGIDSSPNMIEAARQRLPTVQFEVDDITTWHDKGPFDVIFANAALQWVPNHEVLLPSLLSKLTPGGTLAVQMPDNFDEPAHRLMRETAAQGAWAGRLSEANKRLERHSVGWYYSLLQDRGLSLDIWRTTYYHPLSGGAAAIVDWFKGTGLRPFLDPLDESEQLAYLSHYQQAIAEAYPSFADGSVLLPFPRLFMVIGKGY